MQREQRSSRMRIPLAASLSLVVRSPSLLRHRCSCRLLLRRLLLLVASFITTDIALFFAATLTLNMECAAASAATIVTDGIVAQRHRYEQCAAVRPLESIAHQYELRVLLGRIAVGHAIGDVAAAVKWSRADDGSPNH